MFVQQRSWSDRVHRWHYGKVHWMTEPWVTKCGKEVEGPWILRVKYHQSWTSGCKRCGLA
jgi:hypothetical protein